MDAECLIEYVFFKDWDARLFGCDYAVYGKVHGLFTIT